MTRKISADNIFTGTEFTGPSHVLIADESGCIDSILHLSEAGEGVETMQGILCPGFINAHCHIELSHLKNKIPQLTGLVDFVQAVLSLRSCTYEEKQDSMFLAENELYESGTVAVGDICNTTDSIFLKSKSRLYWHNFIEISGFTEEGAKKRFLEAEQIASVFNKQLMRAVVSPHSPYSVSKKLFEFINSATENKLISIHNQESHEENELYNNKSGGFLKLYENLGIDISSFHAMGKSSFQTWLSYFTKGQKIISVHNTFTKTSDLRHSMFNFPHSNLFFCFCPNANLYIENTLPPVETFMKNNCNIVLGTDSYASNTALNIYQEIKTMQLAFPKIPLHIILQWATLNGATALGIDNTYGSFDKGKRPGIVLLTNDKAKRIL